MSLKITNRRLQPHHKGANELICHNNVHLWYFNFVWTTIIVAASKHRGGNTEGRMCGGYLYHTLCKMYITHYDELNKMDKGSSCYGHLFQDRIPINFICISSSVRSACQEISLFIGCSVSQRLFC